MKKAVILAIQTGVTVALLYWIFHNQSLRDRLTFLIAHADRSWIAVGLAAAGAGNLLGVLRWKVYLDVLEIRLPILRVTQLYFIGVLFNSVMLGMVGGDVVKVGVLIAEGHRKTAALLSVMLDRISGFAALAGTAAAFLGMRWAWFNASKEVAGIVWFVIAFLALSLAGLVVSFVGAGTGLDKRLPVGFPGRARIEEFSRAYFVFASHWRGTLWASFLSCIMLVLYFLTFFAAARAVGVGVGFFDFSCIMPLVDVICAMPVSLGGLGVREKVFETLLGSLLGVPAAEAVLVSLGGFLFMTLWGLPGLVFLPLYRGLIRDSEAHVGA